MHKALQDFCNNWEKANLSSAFTGKAKKTFFFLGSVAYCDVHLLLLECSMALSVVIQTQLTLSIEHFWEREVHCLSDNLPVSKKLGTFITQLNKFYLNNKLAFCGMGSTEVDFKLKSSKLYVTHKNFRITLIPKLPFTSFSIQSYFSSSNIHSFFQIQAHGYFLVQTMPLWANNKLGSLLQNCSVFNSMSKDSIFETRSQSHELSTVKGKYSKLIGQNLSHDLQPPIIMLYFRVMFTYQKMELNLGLQSLSSGYGRRIMI